MMNPHELFAEWSTWWWPFLVTHLWQSTLFMAATGLAVLWLRGASASARHRAWLLGSLKFALPALVLAAPLGWLGVSRPVSVPFLTPPALTADFGASSQPTAVRNQPPAVSRQLSVVNLHSESYCLLSLAWLTGLVFLGSRWVWSSGRLSRSIRQSRRVDDPYLLKVLESASREVGLKRTVRVLVSPVTGTPAACGIWRPVILVPPNVTQELNGAELTAVLTHEMVHIKHFDNLLAALQRLLCCIFWFHPAIWLLERRLLAERELSCDQAVVSLTAQPEAYAAGILKICRFSLKANPAGVSLASGSSLGRRIRMITSKRPQRNQSSHHLVFVALLCALVFLTLAVTPAAQAIPEQSLKLGSCPQCPVTVLETRLKAEGDPVEALAPMARVRNDSDRAVAFFYLVLENPAVQERVYFKVSERLEPGEVKTVTVRNQRVLVAVEEEQNRTRIQRMPAASAYSKLGDIAAVEAKVPTVVFADETSFALKGYLPGPPPPPPAPPAPPAPRAPAAGDSVAPAPPTPPAAPTPPVPPEDSSSDEKGVGGVVGGVPGGVKGGVPRGVVGGVPGGVKGGVPRGVVGGVPGGVKGGVPGGVKKPRPAPAPSPAPAAPDR